MKALNPSVFNVTTATATTLLAHNTTTTTNTKNYQLSWVERHQSEGGGELTIVDYIELISLACILLCIVSGNVLVIVSFVTVGRTMRTVTNCFVVNLAISDIFVGCFSLPIWMILQIRGYGISSTPHLVYVAFDIMCGVASIVSLTMISLERAFAVVRPAMHRNLSRQKHLILSALLFIWAFAIINSSLYYVKVYYHWRSYTIYIVSVGFVLPALVIVGSYVTIYKVAQQHVSEVRRLKQEMRLAGMIAIVIVLFLACWFPFFLVNVLYTYCQQPHCKRTIMKRAIPFLKFLHYSNSMMNPVVYAYRNSDYREAFKSLLYPLIRKKKHWRNNSAKMSLTLTSDLYETTS